MDKHYTKLEVVGLNFFVIVEIYTHIILIHFQTL